MGDRRVRKRHVGLIVTILAWLIAPTYFLWIGPKSDPQQNKCRSVLGETGRRNPDRTPRPMEKVHVVDLTTFGEFVDRCAITDAYNDLLWDKERATQLAIPRRAEAVAGLPKLVVLYIHGWLHNGAPDDDDRLSFEALVEELRAKNRGSKNVVGIYVGWPATFGMQPFSLLSFWPKAHTADRIAQAAPVTAMIGAIDSMIDRRKANPDVFVAIGHSFGARLLFSAAAQPVVVATQRAHPTVAWNSDGDLVRTTYSNIRGLADLIVLLNPAFPASLYSVVDSLTRNEDRFSTRQLPVSLLISSDNDYATRLAFPVGQWFGGERAEREMATVGNYPRFQSHELVRRGSAEECRSVTDDRFSERYYSSGLCLARTANKLRAADGVTPEAQAYNPFIVARTTGDVIDGHGGIWENDFPEWLIDYVQELVRQREAGAAGNSSQKE